MTKSELSFGLYQTFVADTQLKPSVSAEWQKHQAGYFVDEHLEVYLQHGPGFHLLMFSALGETHEDYEPSLRFGMADELSDCIWFATDVANKSGVSLSDVCAGALQSHVATSKKIETFKDLNRASIEHAELIAIRDKYNEPRPLNQRPGYCFTRSGDIMRKYLDRDLFASHEPNTARAARDALGNYLLAIAYMSQTVLDISIEDIAAFNMEKITHRREHGKINDIHFDRSRITK